MSEKNRFRKRINKRFIPNIFTVLNMYLGFSAIVLLINGNPIQAAWFIFSAAILDAFDGKLARILGIESTFGTEFDSFADTISFCVTSSLLIYTTWTTGLHPILAIIFSFIPILLGTIRLAKFNVNSEELSFSYTGLTTPLYANLLFGYVLFSNYLFGNLGDPRIGLALTLIMGMLMVMRFELGVMPYLSFKKGRKNNIRLISGILLLVSIILWEGLLIFPVLICYILLSVLKSLLRSEKLAIAGRIKPDRN